MSARRSPGASLLLTIPIAVATALLVARLVLQQRRHVTDHAPAQTNGGDSADVHETTPIHPRRSGTVANDAIRPRTLPALGPSFHPTTFLPIDRRDVRSREFTNRRETEGPSVPGAGSTPRTKGTKICGVTCHIAPRLASECLAAELVVPIENLCKRTTKTAESVYELYKITIYAD